MDTSRASRLCDMGAGVLLVVTGGLVATVAHRLRRDPEIVALGEQLKQANELYAAAGIVTQKQRDEIEDLNCQIREMRKAREEDEKQLKALEERLEILLAKSEEPT
jgi:chromosome segregation ATPase